MFAEESLELPVCANSIALGVAPNVAAWAGVEGGPRVRRAGSDYRMSALRRIATILLIVAGGLACAYGTLVLASIGSSDSASEALVAGGLIFVVPGIAAIAGGTRLQHRRRP
jgi:hypothetical protein